MVELLRYRWVAADCCRDARTIQLAATFYAHSDATGHYPGSLIGTTRRKCVEITTHVGSLRSSK
jgi:hypothetical protein